jgi:CheY-like chemotaxis protein
MKSSQALDPQAVRTSDRESKRILFVDDDVDLRSAMKVLLEREGYEVELAPNGLRALELWRAAPFDVLVTDLFMPQMDGFETIVAARRELPLLKIVAMSSGGGHCRPDMYLSTTGVAGADAAVRKPFQIETLLEVLNELTGVRGSK